MLTPEQNHQQLIKELTRDEGLRMTVYDDATGAAIKPGYTVKGHPTIGVGRALDVRGITPAEAEYLVENDIRSFSLGLAQAFVWLGSLDQVRQRALVNMAFNLGIAGLLSFHDTLELLSAHNWEAAAHAMENSTWYHQTGARAARIVAMIRTGEVVG